MAERFRLAKVLDARRMAEDRRKQELASAERALSRERAVLARLREQADAYRAQAVQPPPGRMDVQRETALRALLHELAERLGRQAGTVAQCEARTAARRAALVKAAQERKILEKLEARAQAAQRLESDAREQLVVDEIARQTHVRSEARHAEARRDGRSGEEAP